MKRGFIFPGQGAQYVGMGKDFAENFAVAKHTFQEADDLLGMHLSRLIFEGPETELIQTKNSQVAIFVTSAAILRVLDGLMPVVCAGLSLGEYAALFASKRLSFTATLKLVQTRAQFMNDACEATQGTMAAVLGLEAKALDEALQGAEGVWVANYNAPGQTVISGTVAGVAKASEVLKAKGAKRVIPLNVHGAFHSPLMASAQKGLAPFIEAASLQESSIDFAMNAPGNYVTNTADVKKYLIAQVAQSVRWEESIEKMKQAGVESLIEIGCGKTLAGLNRKMGMPTISMENLADLEAFHATA